jgi:hypothetical protein
MAAEPGRVHVRRHVPVAARRVLVLKQPLKDVDRAVERAADRAVLLLAVPPAVFHLLAEQPLHDRRDVHAEVGAERDRPAVDARLHLPGEERLGVVLPLDVVPHQGDGAAGRRAGRVEAERAQQRQAPGGGGPRGEQGAALRGAERLPPLLCLFGIERRRAARPLAVRPLQREQPCAPALVLHPGSFGGYFAGRRVGQVAHHLPADRRVAVK